MTNFEKPHDAGTVPEPAANPDAAPAPAPAHTQAPTHPPTQGVAGFDDRGHVKRGRISTLWIALIAVAVVLILLIVFIAQNLKKASIHFLGLSGHMPIGLLVLISAIIGVLLAAVPGTIRILQLRKSLKHNTPKDARTP